MRKLLLGTLALSGSVALALPALAAPTLSYRVYEDGVLLPGVSASSTSGSLNGGPLSTPSGNFNLTLSAFGAPLLPEPSMAAQTTSVSTGAGFTGSHSIRIEVTQTDIAASSLAGGLASTFTANFLINGAEISGVRISNYVDDANGAFVRGQQLESRLFDTGTGAQSFGPTTATPGLTGSLFSETMVFEATFGGRGASLQASSQIIGVPVAVPEPASLALFGSGLLGLGLLRATRRKG